MPSIEVATEFSSSELEDEYKEKETPCASSGSLGDQEVSVSALLAVIYHKATKMKDGFPLPPGCLSQEELTEVYPYENSNLAFKKIYKWIDFIKEEYFTKCSKHVSLQISEIFCFVLFFWYFQYTYKGISYYI